jgi:hypothetical protein
MSIEIEFSITVCDEKDMQADQLRAMETMKDYLIEGLKTTEVVNENSNRRNGDRTNDRRVRNVPKGSQSNITPVS